MKEKISIDDLKIIDVTLEMVPAMSLEDAMTLAMRLLESEQGPAHNVSQLQ